MKTPEYIEKDNRLLIFIRFKLREWTEILTNEDRTEKQTEEIRRKLEKIFHIMYGGHHKKLRETDEFVTKLYYSCKENIEEIREDFDLLKMSVKDFVHHSKHIKTLLEFFFWIDDDSSIIEKANHILFAQDADGRVVPPSEMAIDFVVQATGLSEDRILKKKKIIYKSG